MLVVLAIALLAVGVATLGIGLFSNTLGWVFVSVGATALALLPLFVMYRRGRHVEWSGIDGETMAPDSEDPSDWRSALRSEVGSEVGPGREVGAGSGPGPEVGALGLRSGLGLRLPWGRGVRRGLGLRLPRGRSGRLGGRRVRAAGSHLPSGRADRLEAPRRRHPSG